MEKVKDPLLTPAWTPDDAFIKTTNLAHSIAELNFKNYSSFHEWSTQNFEKFWNYVIHKLKIVFKKSSELIVDLTQGVTVPNWLPGAKLNIIESCFTASPQQTALIFQDENHHLKKMSYDELNRLSNRIANSLIEQGFLPTDKIAIDMPMNYLAVAIYLGIIKMGGVVVSIADSFSPEEISVRLRIANTKAIFTQDFILRGEKLLPLYEKIISAQSPRAIVVTTQKKMNYSLRKNDITWENFLKTNESFEAYPCEPMSACNILFSSGTTAAPKAIPWNHITPIKVASDAFFHQNIQPNDVLAWPTNLGWMMGPWLIFAALINQATIALYDDVPRDRAFGEFIAKAKVTMLGVVPTLVASWRQSHCMEGLDWSSIKLFSSTGECSNPDDMRYLMSLAGNKPIIEYCGGTEIGGAYITSTLIESNYPSVFTTPTLGLDFILLDEKGNETDEGEVAIIPPSIGLSTELLNADHDKIYYANMPTTADGKILRRHGDQIRRIAKRYYTVLGRADDAMNLGGIKVSSADIERVLIGVDDILETAAISVSAQGQGPSQLVIYAATEKELDKESIKKTMQKRINENLNPLFKIHDVVFVPQLPKTASNKIMRRVLRKQ